MEAKLKVKGGNDMLTAIDIEGNKRIPYMENTSLLRILSNEQKIHCPECETPVTLVAGSRKITHFRHHPNVECSYNSEPETEEHLKGKILLYEWLKKKYPEAKVELEFKVKETNQRADVIAIFPTGKKWAFEMQCSAISGELWKKRTNLYKQAGIEDFWFIGIGLHSHGITGGKVDVMKHRLKDLPLTIFENKGWLLFLNTESKEFNGFYNFIDHTWNASTVLRAEGNQFNLDSFKKIESFFGDEKVEQEYANWIEAEQKCLQRQKEEQERQRKIIEVNKRIEEKKIQAAKNYREELRNFKIRNIVTNMTEKEKDIFKNLLIKHKLNNRTFPATCKIHVEHMDLIITPYPLWQLYIYDRYIYPCNKSPKVWIPKIKEDIEKKFRIIWDKDQDANFSFAIYRYFEALEKTGLVVCLSKKNRKYYQVLSNNLPKTDSFKNQSYIAYYLSIHSNRYSADEHDLREKVLKVWNSYKEECENSISRTIKKSTNHNSTNYYEKSEKSQFKQQTPQYQSIFTHYKELEYMINLYKADSSSLNYTDSKNLIKFNNQVQKDDKITRYQWEQYLELKQKIEKHYDISLDV